MNWEVDMICQGIRSVILFVCLVASAVLAADVAPMYFDGVDDTLQQKYWDKLMTFKAWGTNGFSMYRGTMPDTSGAIGTAKGNIDLQADGIELGGKILVGGNLIFEAGTGKLIKGPVRTTGNFTSGTNGSLNYQGTYCIEGVTDYGAKIGIQNAGGRRLEGDGAKSGVCSYDQVDSVPTTLKVPLIKDSESLYNAGGTIDISGSDNVYYIDVPRIEEGEGKLWDLYYQSVYIHDGGELRVRMPANGGGRLVRIFLNHAINFNAGAMLRVEYVNEGAVYSNGQWTNVNDSSKVLTNEEYAGNLLIYMKDDVTWDAFHGDDRIQGSLVTQGTMEIGSNLHLAGQLIAEELKIIAEFDGSGFRYVPFDPAVLDPELFSVRDFEENGIPVEVPVRLDTNTVTDVFFNYCFELTDEEPVDGKTLSQKADITDFDAIPHLCGDGEPGRVTILAGSKYPTEETKIYITVKLDAYKEMYGTSLKEGFKLRVFDMVGAVLKDNATEGYFALNIIDRNIYPETRDTTFAVAEDDTIHFSEGMFPYYSLIDAKLTGVRVEMLPASNRGTLTYKGKIVVKNQIIPVDSLDDLTFVPAKNYYDVYGETELTTLKFAVVDANDAISSEDKTLAGELVGNKELVITVNPVNDPPVAESATYTAAGHSISGGTILKGSIPVTDLDDDEFTYAFDKNDKNFALVDSLFVIDEKTGAISVKDGIVLKRLTNDSLFTISVVVKDKSASTGKDEDILSTTSDVTLKLNYGYNPPAIEIVEGVNPGGKWTNPSIIKTHIPTMELSCLVNGSKEKEVCMDSLLVEGCRYYRVETPVDEDYDGIAYDSIQICLNTATPFVSVSVDKKELLADNVYTIVEEVDSADPKIYVNSLEKEVHVIVDDVVTGFDKDYTVNLKLDTAGVPKNVLGEMKSVIKANIALDETKPAKVISVNGSTSLHTYKVAYQGSDSVTVSYETDHDGDIVKIPVVNADGEIDSIAVYMVTYVTLVDGKEVSISYTVDALSGDHLMVDSEGRYLTQGAASKKGVNAVPYTVSYDYKDSNGNTVNMSYGVDEDGSLVRTESGDIGYRVSYTYVNEYGNSATKSVFVVLDQIGPKVEIISPRNSSVHRANFVEVIWEVNGVEQDTLKLQSLDKGANRVFRYYKDKAGNVAYDSILVFMKDAKDVDVAEERPVTVMSKDKVDEYYASNAPVKNQKYAVSVRNPKTGTEVETLKGGSFGKKDGSGKAPYPGMEEKGHLGPTLVVDIKLPVVNAVGGLATLDDLIGADGKVAIDGIDAKNSRKIPIDEYVSTYCEKGFDYSKPEEANLYDITSNVKIWIYTNLGNFVDYFSFSQKMNDPSYTDDVGQLQMFFEQKPDKNGDIRDANGRVYATGAYLYKVDVGMKPKLRCTLPPVDDKNGKKKGPMRATDDRMLKPFGYMRPEK